MTIQQLRAAHKAAPSRPFTLHLADGRSFPVPRPGLLCMPPKGLVAIVFAENDECDILDLSMMTEIRMQPAASARP